MFRKETTDGVGIIIEPLDPKNIQDLRELKAILDQHVVWEGQVLSYEIGRIISYMKGRKDEFGRIRTFFVAKRFDEGKKGEVLGCMAYSLDPDPDMCKHFESIARESAELLSAFVSNKVFRGGGVGKRLFNIICDAAKREGKNWLIVNSGPRYKDSWGFYDKVCDKCGGFIPDKYGEGYHAKTWLKFLH